MNPGTNVKAVKQVENESIIQKKYIYIYNNANILAMCYIWITVIGEDMLSFEHRLNWLKNKSMPY